MENLAGRRLPVARMDAHAHAAAPDHHGRWGLTLEQPGHLGPIPVAASPQKRRLAAAPRFG